MSNCISAPIFFQALFALRGDLRHWLALAEPGGFLVVPCDLEDVS